MIVFLLSVIKHFICHHWFFRQNGRKQKRFIIQLHISQTFAQIQPLDYVLFIFMMSASISVVTQEAYITSSMTCVALRDQQKLKWISAISWHPRVLACVTKVNVFIYISR